MKNKYAAAALAFFLGGLGIHKFYLGKTWQGILYLLFCWTLIPSIIAFIEAIIYIFESDSSFDYKYNKSGYQAQTNYPPGNGNGPMYRPQPQNAGMQDRTGKICPQCSCPNAGYAKFCESCGSPFN